MNGKITMINGKPPNHKTAIHNTKHYFQNTFFLHTISISKPYQRIKTNHSTQGQQAAITMQER